MKVLIVTSPIVDLRKPYCGSTEEFVVHLANALVSTGEVEVDIICGDSDETDLFNRIHLEKSNLAMGDYNNCEQSGQIQFYSYQYGLLDLTDYDIIHLNSYSSDLIEMSSIHPIRTIITLQAMPTDNLALIHRLNSQRTESIYVAASKPLKKAWKKYIKTEIKVIKDNKKVTNKYINLYKRQR